MPQPREMDRTRQNLGKDFPNWRTSEQGLRPPERGLVENEVLQGLPRDLGEDDVLEDQEVLVEGA